VQHQVANIIEGSIVDLSQFKNDTFDAVVCLGGPLSHVLDAQKRDRAIAELARVTREGGCLFASVMSRLSLLVIELVLFPDEIEMPHFRQIRDTGDYEGERGFTACHFFLPEEFRGAFSGKGVEVLEMVGLEGISSHHDKKLNQVAREPKRWPTWLETHFQTCTHPAVVGLSEHMLAVCRKT
jgi:SAM-dependent methyltransferase